MGDENYFLAAKQEYEAGKLDKRLLAKARTMAAGEERALESKYILLRVEQLKSKRRREVADATIAASKIVAPAIGSYLFWLLKGVVIIAVIIFLTLSLL